MKTAQLFQPNSPIKVNFEVSTLDQAIAYGRVKYETMGLIGRCYIQFSGVIIAIA
jgi:hypothetical protein